MTAPADGGRANEAVVELLAETVAVPRANVRLVSGHAARDKIVDLVGVAPDETERRLAAAGENGSA